MATIPQNLLKLPKLTLTVETMANRNVLIIYRMVIALCNPTDDVQFASVQSSPKLKYQVKPKMAIKIG